MYTIVAVTDGKEYPLHNLKSRRLIVSEPYFEIGDNLNGQAEFKVFAGHPYYGKVKKLTTDIIIRNGSKDMFYGRVLYDDEDSNGTKQVFVEGELAFLCDSIQRPREYHNIGVRDYLTNVIKIHNDQVEARKHFTVGRVTVEDANDSLYRFSNWETTRETLKDKLSDRLGGHFVIRHENGIRYLDYLDDDDYYSRCAQRIKFGKNLLSFARNFDATDLATCIIPLGTTLEESSIEGLDERLTIKEVNGGKDYVTDDAAVAAYGKIYKTIIFDDITLPANLKTKGQKYLTQTQYEKMVLECKAIDLNFTDEEFESFSLGSLVRCVSEPHALDAWYPVTKQKFYLTDFKKNTITLGDESSNVTYTSSNRQSTATFREDLETYRTGLTERIEKARSDFKVAIENGNGLYSTDVEQENGSIVTYYHNKKDLESSSIRLVFNDAGFAVSNNAGEDWYGIKVDGDFIAKILNAMGVNAGWINTGVLRVTDAKGKEVLYVDVDAGVVRITPEMFALASGETINSIVDAATNKKCSVFTSQPKPPYNTGDLWFDGSDVLTCVTARKSGNYQKADWEKKVDYIDQSAADTAASNAIKDMKQTDILNKLTNNGNDKAIYMLNGKLYISFSAMRGDELTLGGSNNVNGILRVLNGSGTEIGTWDKDGIHLKKGEINGPTITVGGNGNKEGIINVLNSSGFKSMEINSNGLKFFDGTSSIFGRARLYGTSDGFSIEVLSGTSNAIFYVNLTKDGEFDVGAGKICLHGGTGEVQLPQKVYSYAIPQSTAACGATFDEEASSFNGSNYNFRLYRGTHSSRRYKDIGRDMCDEDIEELYNIIPVWAKYKDGYLGKNDERCGVEHPMFIAEDVEKYAPLAVDHNKEGQAENWNYRVMIPYMFQMLKEQKKEIEQLKKYIEESKKGGE